MEQCSDTWAAVAMATLFLGFVILPFIYPSPEKRFLNERCIKGGKHDAEYVPDLEHQEQELRCTKCNKSILISKKP